MRSCVATCERRLTRISYFTSDNNRLEIDETTCDKIMEDLLVKDKKSKMTRLINEVLPLI